MFIHHIDSFDRGWIVGDFDQSIFKGDHELGIKSFKKGFREFPHYHTEGPEMNVVLKGLVIANGKFVHPGGIFIFEANEPSQVDFLEDTILVVYRPYSKNDKVSYE